MSQDVFTKDQLKQLSSQLKPGIAKPVDVGGGRKADYIPGHISFNNANLIFGYGNWGTETKEMIFIGEDSYPKIGRNKKAIKDEDGKPVMLYRVYYRARATVTVRGCIPVDGWGAGEGTSTTSLKAHDKALKEAETDAFKRALRLFGPQFGLHLYGNMSPMDLKALASDTSSAIYNDILDEAKRLSKKFYKEGIDVADEFFEGKITHSKLMLTDTVQDVEKLEAFIDHMRNELEGK